MEYRVVKRKYKSGRVVFVPQVRDVWGEICPPWASMVYKVGPQKDEIIQVATLERARFVIEDSIRVEQHAVWSCHS